MIWKKNHNFGKCGARIMRNGRNKSVLEGSKMKVVKDLKDKFTHYLIFRKNKQKNYLPGKINFEQAKSIGIVYSANEDTDKEALKDFINELNKEAKEVTSIEFSKSNNKRPTEMLQTKNKLHFSKKDLNLLKIPRKTAIHNFVNRQYDVLIELSDPSNLPLHYISAASKAKLKIGPYNPHYSQLFDLMINEPNNSNIQSIIEIVKKYTRNIHKN